MNAKSSDRPSPDYLTGLLAFINSLAHNKSIHTLDLADTVKLSTLPALAEVLKINHVIKT